MNQTQLYRYPHNKHTYFKAQKHVLCPASPEHIWMELELTFHIYHMKILLQTCNLYIGSKNSQGHNTYGVYNHNNVINGSIIMNAKCWHMS